MTEFNAIHVSAPEQPPTPEGAARVTTAAEPYVFSSNARRWKYVRLAFAGLGLGLTALALAMLALCLQPAVLPSLALKVSPDLSQRGAVVAHDPVRQRPHRLLVARLHWSRRRHGLRYWQRSAARLRGVRTL